MYLFVTSTIDMKTLTLYTKLDMLPSELKNEVSDQKVPTITLITKRAFGSLKGMIHLSEDFDAPLEDFREHM